MNLQLPERGSFDCIALRTRSSTLGPIKLGDTLFASSRLPIVVDEFWKEQIGALGARRINDCNLFIYTVRDDSNHFGEPRLTDLHSFYFGLLLQGRGYSAAGSVLGGSIQQHELRIGSLGELNKYYEPAKVLPDDVEAETIIASIKLAAGINKLYSNPTEAGPYLRLRKGFNAFLEGIQQTAIHERLHQFVRAIEAVVKPKLGEYRRNFVSRARYFAGTSGELLLSQLYEMRSAAEHLNPLAFVLDQERYDRLNLIALKAYQAEILAGYVYSRILVNPYILENFETDQAIEKLWATGAQPRRLFELFGDAIDLDLAAQKNFHSYLEPH